MNKDFLVSMVVTTRNEGFVIGRLIQSLKKQTYCNTEIILVDNYSSDDTVKIAKSFGVRVFMRGPERSCQRNFGARKSKGDFLLFLDADMELRKDVVEKCVQAALDNQADAVVIPEQSVAGNFWEHVKAFERSFYNLQGDETDAARFFSREAFERAKGFDESITGPEDWDLPEEVQRLGFSIGRADTLIYHHERIPSIVSLARKKYYYALKAHRYLSKRNSPVISSKTIYFLRPVFYKNWTRLVRSPLLTCSMIGIFTVEIAAGAVGYIVGLVKND